MTVGTDTLLGVINMAFECGAQYWQVQVAVDAAEPSSSVRSRGTSVYRADLHPEGT
jgi:hypothetical protein